MIEESKDPAKIEEMKQVLAQIDELDQHELGKVLKTYGVKSPETGNDITDPFPFNLMFETQIGPTGDYKVLLLLLLVHVAMLLH